MAKLKSESLITNNITIEGGNNLEVASREVPTQEETCYMLQGKNR